MKKLAIMLLALLPAFALAQVQPVIPSGTTLGNASGAARTATPIPAAVRSTTAPTNPYPNQLWQSQSVATLEVSSAMADRSTMLTGEAGGFENGFAQEPSVFWNPTAGNWGMVYSGTTGLGYATASAPGGPWTRRGAILGSGVGGFAGPVSHARAVVIGGLIYISFPDFAGSAFRITNGAAMPSGTNVPVFSSNSIIFTPDTGALGITPNLMGNSRILQVGSTYYLFWEAFQTGIGWQTGSATSNSLSGTYTLGVYPYTTLRTVSSTQSAVGGPFALYENGQFVLYYHAGGGPSTQIYRAFSPDAADNWTIDNNGQPWLDRQLPNEVSQVADINIVPAATGVYYAYWDAINNNTSLPAGNGAVNFAHVLEPTYLYDSTGSTWAQVGGIPKTTPLEFNDVQAGIAYVADADVQNNQVAVFDPNTAGMNLTATLPYADVGARARVCNASYMGAQVVNTVAQSSDSITGGSPALAAGLCSTFYSFLPNNWTRDLGISTRGTTDFLSGSVVNFAGLLQMLPGSFFTMYSSGGGFTNLLLQSSGSNFNATLPANSGTIAELNLAQTWTAAQSFASLLSAGTTFTLGAGTGACATTSTLSGGAQAGRFLCTGTAGASSKVINLPTAANGWSCSASDVTSGVVWAQTATTIASCTIAGAIATTGDAVVFQAIGY